MSSLRTLRIVAALVTLLVLSIDRGTGALWNDSGTVPGGTIRTGRLDVKVDGQDAIADYAPLDLPLLVPGQTAATVLTISNAGSVPVQWAMSTSGSDASSALVGALRAAAMPMADGAVCDAPALPAPVIPVGESLLRSGQALDPGTEEQVCVWVGLPAATDPALAGKAIGLRIDLRGATGGWFDTAAVAGIDVITVTRTPPAVTCLLGLTMTWTEVPGATAYHVYNGLGRLVDTILPNGLLQATTTLLGSLVGAKVEAVFGSEWVSPKVGC